MEALLEPGQALSPADYLRIARQLEALDEPRLRVHVSSSFSAEFLRPLLTVEAYRSGLLLDLSFGPFGQLEQELFEDASPIWHPENRATIVLFRPQDLEPDLDQAPRSVDVPVRLAELEDRLIGFATRLRERNHSPLLVADAAPPSSREAGTPSPVAGAFHAYNARLGERLGELVDCHVLDWSGAVADFGAHRWADPRLWYLARVPFGQEAAAWVARRTARRLASVLLPRAKCVVVDLDETVWGGAIGDDGVEGIQLGGDYPGNVFRDFQLRLKELTRTGVVLAIASKNDEANVREAFERHPDMVLAWDDFASHQISWEPKEVGIRRIAADLDLGLDSLVLLDDSELECAAVAAAVPEVEVVCLGRDPLRFQAILDTVESLDRPVVTGEDRARGTMYAQARRRRADEATHQSREEFLASLEMVAEVAPADAVTLPRVGQLIGKTNQFNLTTRRHTIDQVRAMVDDDDHRVQTLRLADAHGDLGLVCVGILRRSPDAPSDWVVDTLLMSCRAMGRGVEDAFLAHLAEVASEAGGQRLLGEYVPSAKNGIVRDLYPSHGFTAVPDDPGAGPQWFSLELREGANAWPTHIRRHP